MGTRSTTRFMVLEEGNEPQHYLSFYRQFDGYVDGHGHELANILKSYTMVNGITCGERRKVANGEGCLIAQVLSEFKNGEPGGFYVIPSGEYTEEYHYDVEITKKWVAYDVSYEFNIKVFTGGLNGDLIFEGTPSKLLEFKEDND